MATTATNGTGATDSGATNGDLTRFTHERDIVERVFKKYPVHDIYISIDSAKNIEEGALRVVKALFPEWEISHLRMKQYADGITNKLFKVSISTTGSRLDLLDSQGFHPTLIRVYGAKTELIIDREQEIVTLVSLSEQGLTPPLYGRFTNGMCYGYTPGVPYTPDTMRDPQKSLLVAQKLARFHQVDVPGDPSPKLFATIRKWYNEVPESFDNPAQDARFKEQFNRAQSIEELAWLEKELLATDPDVVFCHNDLLCGNILYDDGGQTPEAHFIDFEYGGYNYRYFDIGNHFCEMMGYDIKTENYPNKEFQLLWLDAYKKHAKLPRDISLEELYSSVNKFAMAAHFFWGIWALVQARYSDIDFDYLNYSRLRFAEYYARKPQFFSTA